MDKFEKKTQEIQALKACYDAIESRINMEQDYNFYKPGEDDKLEDWQLKVNEETDYRISVYRKIQEYIEKLI